MQLIFLMLAAQAAGADAAQDATASQPPLLLDTNVCAPADAPDEIVICGRGQDDKRYRIPEMFRGLSEPGDRAPGIGPVSLDANPFAPCGIFQGERRCNKDEAALYGYGNGRNPLAVAGRIIDALDDPE